MGIKTNESDGQPVSGQLDQLLSETVHAVIEREKTSFDRAAGEFAGRIVLFGAGALGRRTLAGMQRIGTRPLAFADNHASAEKFKDGIDGVPVYSPSKAAELYGETAVFLITIWGSFATDKMRDRVRQLQDLGCQHVCPAGIFFWKYPEIFLPYYPLDLPHKALHSAADIKSALNLFTEGFSRTEYLAQIRFRLLQEYDGMSSPLGAEQYFAPDLFDFRDDEVFVDCGAYDGDTIASLVQQRGDAFGSVVAYEPDALNWNKLQDRLRRYPAHITSKIKAMPYALGSKRCTVQFDSTGTETSSMGQGTISVECVTLDESLRGISPTFLKFDIEGAEPDALAGAQETIRRCRPVLAVSVYHQQDHLWRIPLQLAEM